MKEDSRQAGTEEIEITPEMIEAGKWELYGYDRTNDDAEVVLINIIEAVFAAAPESFCAKFPEGESTRPEIQFLPYRVESSGPAVAKQQGSEMTMRETDPGF